MWTTAVYGHIRLLFYQGSAGKSGIEILVRMEKVFGQNKVVWKFLWRVSRKFFECAVKRSDTVEAALQ